MLKTEADYDAALAYVDTLMDAAPGSPEENELIVFALLIDTYEQTHYPIELLDPRLIHDAILPEVVENHEAAGD